MAQTPTKQVRGSSSRCSTSGDAAFVCLGGRIMPRRLSVAKTSCSYPSPARKQLGAHSVSLQQYLSSHGGAAAAACVVAVVAARCMLQTCLATCRMSRQTAQRCACCWAGRTSAFSTMQVRAPAEGNVLAANSEAADVCRTCTVKGEVALLTGVVCRVCLLAVAHVRLNELQFVPLEARQRQVQLCSLSNQPHVLCLHCGASAEPRFA